MSSIYEKLQSARVELQGMKLKKSGKNKFAGYDYYELSDFLPAVNDLFKKYGLFSLFSLTEGLAMLTIIDSTDDTKSIDFTSPIETLDLKGCNKLQALGGVHTYMKRYLYQNALEIVENDMFDAQTGTDKVLERDPDEDLLLGLKATVSPDEAERYYQEHKEHAEDFDNFKACYAKHWKALKRKEEAQNG